MPAVGRLNVVGIDAVGYEESEYSVVLVESQMLVPSSCVTVPVAGPVVVKASSISVVVEKPGELSRTELSDVVLAQAVPLQPEIAPPVTNWSSVLAACVVPGVTQALAGTNAKKVYVANLHGQIPETEGYTLEDHVDALLRHGVVPHVVLVDHHSEFAAQRCSLPVHIADLSGRNGMVHDVQKLTEAVLAEVR